MARNSENEEIITLAWGFAGLWLMLNLLLGMLGTMGYLIDDVKPEARRVEFVLPGRLIGGYWVGPGIHWAFSRAFPEDEAKKKVRDTEECRKCDSVQEGWRDVCRHARDCE